MSNITTLSLATLLAAAPAALAADAAAKTLPNGKPDLSGVYDAGTVTPVDRPSHFGDNLYLTPEEAQKLEAQTEAFWKAADAKSAEGGERGAPKKGGDGNQAFGAGGVGGYNAFWIDPGSQATMVDGKFRTSIIYEPKNGRRPPMTPAGMKKMASNFASFAHLNDGTASWLDR
ncbi:MAG: hypothetical protein R3190_10190, partial [Thermoanaerobaculia bacterium]|nr:hypothetical protein [Thermoanaerobaculia bacterium]